MPEKPENELSEQARRDIEELKATVQQEVLSEQKQQRRGQLIYAGLGIVIGVAVTAALFEWWGTIAQIQPLLVGVLVVAILAVAGAAVVFIWFRDSIFGKFFKAGVASYEVAVDNVAQNVTGLIIKLAPKLDPTDLQNGVETLKKAGLQIAAYLAYLRVRRIMMGWLVALAAGLAAFLGTTLLVRQNELLNQQMHLTEAARRSSYIFLMGNLIEQINKELDTVSNVDYHSTRKLSNSTIGQIVALSQSLRPIHYLEGETLSEETSPERAYLLLVLVYAKLDTVETYSKIYKNSDFSYADLQGLKLESAFLEGVKLMRANLRGTDISKGHLAGANLEGAKMDLSNLKGAELKRARLMGAQLFGAHLDSALLQEADLTGIKGDSIFLSKANLSKASLLGANLFRATISEASLEGASLEGANLERADLTKAVLAKSILKKTVLRSTTMLYADVTEADLTEADLKLANLRGADLRRTKIEKTNCECIKWRTPPNDRDLCPALDSAKVASSAFLDSLKYQQVRHWEKITIEYKISTIPYKDSWGKWYYLLLSEPQEYINENPFGSSSIK